MKNLLMSFLLFVALTPGIAQPETIQAPSNDGYVSDPAVITSNNPYTAAEMKVGKSAVDGSANCTSGIIPFQLPAIPEGMEISSASLSVYVSYGREWFNSNVDLYGLAYKSSSTISTDDYFTGAFGDGTGNGSDMGIEDDYFTKNVALGTLDTPRYELTSAAGNIKLIEYLNAQYTAGAVENDFVFLRLSVDDDAMTGSQYFKVEGGDQTHPAELTVTFSGIGGNVTPVLSAVGNQSVMEGTQLTIDLAATDSDSDDLTFSAASLPGFASLTDNGDGTGNILVEPLVGDADTYTDIEVSVSDGTISVSETIEIKVLPYVDPNQQINLNPVLTDRFALTEKVWPSAVGEADVCLWNDDKYAVATITIDDNMESDHSWWLSMQESYDLELTWFAILDNVSTWEKYQTLIDAGNEVQGHDDCDINAFSDADYKAELVNTKAMIEANLTGSACLTYAYPCGIADKVDEARQVYISMRGVMGLMNPANRINYLNLNSRSATNDTHDVDVLLDVNEQLWNVSYNRGWLSCHYHGISAIKTETEAFLSYLGSHGDEIWIGKYSEVARYGQERDSHTLTVDEAGAELIKFTLIDNMHDDFFNFPLTVKVRIDNSWEYVSAIQDGSAVEARIIEHEGNKYALVKAVPDAGQVALTEAVAAAPVLVKSDDQEVEEFATLTITISASDENFDDIVLSVENLPSFATFKDNENGTGSIHLEPAVGDAGDYDNIIIVASDGVLSDRDTLSITVTELVGVSMHNTQGIISVYPNPVKNGVLYIDDHQFIEGDNVAIEIFNTLGEKVRVYTISSLDSRYSLRGLEDLSTGVYYLKLMSGRQIATAQFIIE